MPMEYEVKARCPDPAAVEAKLAELGARETAALVQKDTYFRAPHVDFAETDEALRIRRESSVGGEGDGDGKAAGDIGGGRAFLTYKGPKVDSDTKTRMEVETPVRDPGAMTQILCSAGFTPVMEVVKTRRLFSLGELEVCMDHLEGLGHFVEVEYTGEDGGGEAERGAGPKERVLALIRELPLGEHVRTSYLELLLEAGGS